ncbi:MAG: RNA polymerase sigma-70 factor [Balneolaceae bacterium]
MHDLNDTLLAQKIREGSEEAFKIIYDRYHVQMYFIAKKYVKDSALAEDAIQEIFVKLWQKRGKLDETKSLKGFMFTMLRNHVLNMIRDRKKQIVAVSSVEEKLLPHKNLTEDDVLYNEYHDIVKKGINELSGRKREVFELRTLSGYSNSEVANFLNINIRTVKTHYYHSSKFIRAYLKNHSGILFFLLALSAVAFY